MTAHHIDIFILLAALTVSHSLTARHIERLRRSLTEGKVHNLLDVWTVAGALLLPTALVVPLVLISYGAEWPSRKSVNGGRPARYLISVAIVIAAACAAATVRQHTTGPLGIAAAVLSWTAVNSVLIAAVVWGSDDRGLLRQLLGLRNQVADTLTKLTGVVLALLVGWHPVTGLVVLPLVLAGHRLALRDSIRTTSAYDASVRMWSESGWRVQAAESIATAPGCVALVLIDPAQPRSEAAIAQCLRGVLRASDPVGRYGTRQVAALVQVDMEAVGIIVTERVRARLDQAGIACVVGVSISVGEGLGELLLRAGSDLMARRESAGISARW
ncbi:MAG TPA: hypothetical protein VF612_12015 [Jatrophihabitans sp.]|jgi:hypothetical protein|uniref:hypothetical protein n=1 Tax=Jatrophihabitans sp. TaxID=1932789 RepID=UPI002F1266E0